MSQKKKNRLLHSFLKWRYRNISNRTFVHLMSIVSGLVAGLAAVTLKNLTYLIESLLNLGVVISENQLYFILPPVGLALVYVYVKYVHKEPLQHAVSSIIYSLSKKGGLLSMKDIYTPLITAPLTVGFGGSVGMMGPAVRSGSAISSYLSRVFHIDAKTRSLLVTCAATGAIASIFQAPIAAIIFAVEVFTLDLTMMSMLPLLDRK